MRTKNDWSRASTHLVTSHRFSSRSSRSSQSSRSRSDSCEWRCVNSAETGSERNAGCQTNIFPVEGRSRTRDMLKIASRCERVEVDDDIFGRQRIRLVTYFLPPALERIKNIN